MNPETKLEQHLVAQVRKIGGLCYKLVPSVAGMPDRMVLHAGVVYLIEMKTPTGRLRPDQVVWHARAARRGVKVHLLNSREAVDKWVMEISR